MTILEQEIDQLLDRFLSDFSNLDLKAVVSYFHLPCTFIVPREVLLFTSVSEVESFWGPRLDDLKTQGYGRTERLESNINVLNDDTAISSGKAIRYAEDGSELGCRSTTFVLRKTDDAWKIVTLIHHSTTPGYSQEMISGSRS